MEFRFTLSHDVLGTQVISQPGGWKDIKMTLERHSEYHSLFEYFLGNDEGNFVFYGENGEVNGGIDFIRIAEQGYGVDTTVNITVEVSFDGYSFDTLFVGQLALDLLEEGENNTMDIPIIRNDFSAKFKNRTDTPVDLQSENNLDEEPAQVFPPVNLELLSQVVQAKTDFVNNTATLFCAVYDAAFISPDFQVCIDTNEYMQFDWDKDILDEVDDKFSLPTSGNPEKPVGILEAQYDGAYQIDLKFGMTVMNYREAGPPIAAEFRNMDTLVDCYVQINEEVPILLTPVNQGTAPVEWTEWSWSGLVNMKKGDTFRVYGIFVNAGSFGYANNGVTTVIAQPVFLGDDNTQIETSGGITFPTFNDSIDSYFRITANTTYAPTVSETFILHDAAGQILDRIIGQDNTFYSEYLGGVDTLYRQYEADGCEWDYVLSKGLQLRLYDLEEKPFFLSFKQWWEGINPILNLGMGYEIINGAENFRVEPIEHFYDRTMSVLISNVREIQRSYDKELMFKTVKNGYKKWQSEDTSGIDDPQTKHTRASRFQKAGKEITIESDFIAASLAIETTRRTTREKSADYKFDNDTFIIAVNAQDSSPAGYKPQLAEEFSIVNNLLNAQTRYNLKITPARNFLRWNKFLSGGLQQYPTSGFKFTAGEGNYDLETDIAASGCDEYTEFLSEKQTIQVTSDYLHLSFVYQITCPLEWEDYKTIRENRKKAIGISQTDSNHQAFFIKSLSYDLVNGKAQIEAWPVEYFDIQQIPSEITMIECVPTVTVECEDAYLTELGDEFITEDGNCLILN